MDNDAFFSCTPGGRSKRQPEAWQYETPKQKSATGNALKKKNSNEVQRNKVNNVDDEKTDGIRDVKTQFETESASTRLKKQHDSKVLENFMLRTMERDENSLGEVAVSKVVRSRLIFDDSPSLFGPRFRLCPPNLNKPIIISTKLRVDGQEHDNESEERPFYVEKKNPFA